MSFYCSEKNALFLHIPRTGGGWVQYATKRLGIPVRFLGRPQNRQLFNNHNLLGHHHIGNETKFIWSIVRHPLDFYESTWGWLKKNPHDARVHIASKWSWHPLMRPAQLFVEDFNEWCSKMMQEEGEWVTRLFWMYVGPPGGEFCSFIGRTETIEEDFLAVLIRMGYGSLVETKRGIIETTRIPHGSERIRREIRWDESIRTAVLEKEQLVIKRWYQ